MGYSFYNPPENKVFVARNAEFLENSLITQEASGSLEDLEIIQEEDTYPSENTSIHHDEGDQETDEPQSDVIPIRRSTRTRHAPDRMYLYTDDGEYELGDLNEPGLVDLTSNSKTVVNKWLFKKKTDIDRVVHTYKARLVAKGFTQTYKVDYEETFSPVADIRAIRVLIAITAFYDYEIWQMDVKTAFLNGHLLEEVYMVQPEGFVNPKYPNRVCKLKHSIYGLKQASRQWNKRFDDEIKKFGFTQNRDEPCVYMKASGSVKAYLGKCFAMKDLGEAAYILGIKIYRDRSRRLIGASTPDEVKRMQNIPYALTVGSIMYVVRCTRPDVAFAQNITSRFQQNPCELHWTAVKNILKYHHNTKDMFLVYGVSDWIYFVLNGGVVDWKSTKQIISATSSVEAEYIVASDASKEVVWVRKFISGLCIVPTIKEPINMYCDNTGAITIANESGITKGARHYRAKVHYLREVIEFGDIEMEKVHTDGNLADPFTKALPYPKHSEHTKNILMLPDSCSM
ncbi:retrotransposon protein, putative, ty1-copia subclass [Tanacetum coccineum]|uniref:Retrotransposon protein, putative, ty1-copia subclass n=1 Tax=Tanacetum coccineum TaxID=301880 RepID=A0ABQ5E0V8_9ASTR